MEDLGINPCKAANSVPDKYRRLFSPLCQSVTEEKGEISAYKLAKLLACYEERKVDEVRKDYDLPTEYDYMENLHWILLIVGIIMMIIGFSIKAK